MKIKNKIFSYIAFALIASNSSVFAASSCDTQDIIKSMTQKLDAITYYQFNATSTLDGELLTNMTMYGKRPDLLKAVMKGPSGELITVVFDQKYEWIEESDNVYQINLAQLKRKEERPFDTAYSLAGNGLLSGEDYVGTIKTLLNVYDLKSTCKADTITLEGALNIARFTEYTKGREITTPLDAFVKQFSETLGKVSIIVDKNNYLVTSYSLQGSDQSAAFNAVFSDYSFEKLSDEQLSFKLKKGVKPIDITPSVLDDESSQVNTEENNN